MKDHNPSVQFEYVVVEFDLTPLLDLVDSIGFESVPSGYSDYMFAIDQLPVLLRFERRMNRMGLGHVLSDEPRRLGHTVARCVFDRSFFRRYPIRAYHIERESELIRASLSILNFFLESYRAVTGAYWVEPIVADQLGHCRFYGRTKDGHEFPLPQSGDVAIPESDRTLGPDQDKRLRRLVSEGYRPDLLQRMSYRARKLYDEGEYIEVAMLAARIVEAKVARMIRRAFEAKDLTSEQVEAKFRDEEGARLEAAGLLRHHLPELAGIELSEVEDEPLGWAFRAWWSVAHKPYRHLLRGQEVEVTAPQAAGALDAARDLITELTARVGDDEPLEILVP
jgi:hypothetical protein